MESNPRDIIFSLKLECEVSFQFPIPIVGVGEEKVLLLSCFEEGEGKVSWELGFWDVEPEPNWSDLFDCGIWG